MEIQKKQLYIFIALLLVPLFAVVGYFLFKDSNGVSESSDDYFKSCKIDRSLKYYSLVGETRVTTPENLWTQHYVQPIFTGVESEDGVDYIVGALPDMDSNCVKVRFIVSGNIEVKDNSGLFNDFGDSEWLDERVTVKELAERLEVGKQFRVRYLSSGPEQLSEDTCQTFAEGSEYYCTLQRIHQEYLGYDQIELLWVDNINNYPTLFATGFDKEVTLVGTDEFNE